MDRLIRALGQGPSGKIDDRFEILEEAGMGGMGTVYRARDTGSGGFVALKILAAPTRAFLERFALEAKILSELEHPGIVRYVAHGRTAEGEAYLAMEWLEGESLGRRLERSRLGVRETLELGRQIADALALAHAKGVIHRDVKPSNLYLAGEPERVKLLDFGIARTIESAGDLTLTGQLVGTPGYISPEQARGHRNIDGRADLFSLGCVLYRCVTGERAFAGEDVLSVLAKLVFVDPARARRVRSDVPASLENLLDRLLAKSPADRLESAAAAREELDRLLDEVDGAPSTLRQGRLSSHPAFSATDIGSVVLACPGEAGGAKDEDLEEAKRTVSALGGSLVELAGGAVAASLPTGASAEATAACVRTVAGLVPKGQTAIVASEAGGGDDRDVATLIDRASALVRDAPAGSIRVPASNDPTVREVGAALRRLGMSVDTEGAARPLQSREAPPELAAVEPPPNTLLSAPAHSGPSRARTDDVTQVSSTGSGRTRHWSSVAGPALIVAVIAILVVTVVLRRRGASPAPSSSSTSSASAQPHPAPLPAPIWALGIGGDGLERAVAVATKDRRIYAAIELNESLVVAGRKHAVEDGRDAVIAAFDDRGGALWSVGLHGPGTVDVQAIAAAPGGGVLAVGFFHGTLAVGSEKATAPGRDGLFVVRLDASGNVELLRGYGGTDLDLFLGKASIAADEAGRIALAGGYGGTLDLGCGPKKTVDDLDGFVAMLEPDGACRFMNPVGKEGLQALEWVGVDLSKQITAVGEMHGVVELGGRRLESVGGIDVLVVRYDEDGQLKWSRRFGNPSGLQGSVRGAVQSLGAVYLAGWFDGALDLGPSAKVESRGRGHDFFIAKLDAASDVIFARAIHVERPPCPPDRCELDRIGVTVDGAGRSFVALPFEGRLDAGTLEIDARGGMDLAVLSLDAQGTVDWAASMGDEGASCVIPHCVLAVSAGPSGVAVAGGFRGSLGVADVPSSSGPGDAFVMLLSPFRE